MGASTAAGTSLAEVVSIGLSCKYHVNFTIGDAIVWVRGNIVKGLVDSVSGVIGSRALLVSHGAESDKNFVVDHVSVPQKGADGALDAFNSVGVKWI